MRQPNDYYPTPNRVTEKLLELYPFISGRVFEPCNGQGSIADTLEKKCTSNKLEIIRNDITDPYPETSGDCLDPLLWDAVGPLDWVVTNPPFCDEIPDKLLPLAWERVNVGMVFLLRLSFLEPCSTRADFLIKTNENMALIAPLSPRPRFIAGKKGSDSVTAFWGIWLKHWSGGPEYKPITDWKK